MARSHIGFDAYSYQPPSYEEALANGPTNQAVYNPTVSVDTNCVGGFRSLYTPNDCNALSEYNKAKRRRRMRVTVATALGVFCFVLLMVIIYWKINLYHTYLGSQNRQSYDDKNNDDEVWTPYQPYKDSSIFHKNDYLREPAQESNDDVFDKSEADEHLKSDNLFANNGGNSIWQTEVDKMLEKMKLENVGGNPGSIGDENQRPKNKYLDSLFVNLDSNIQREIEKLNLSKFDDGSANLEEVKANPTRETSDSLSSIRSVIQKEIEKLDAIKFDDRSGSLEEERHLFTGKNVDNRFPNNWIDSFFEKEMEKLKSIASSSGNPVSTTEHAYVDIATNERLENEETPDLGKVHDFLESLGVNYKRKKYENDDGKNGDPENS